MQAIHTPIYGPPHVLSLTRVDAPTPGEGELLISVEAVAVTRGDDRLRGAEFPGVTAVIGRAMFGISRPRQPCQGSMFAGTVRALGAGVSRFAVGDRVFGEVSHGAYAEQLVVRADAGVAHIPEGVDAAQVAALPYGAVCSWVFLSELAKVQPGEHVVIKGAGGGVGRYAIQVARHLGARVTAMASARHDTMLGHLELGPEFTLIRHESEIDSPVDVVLDTSGTSHRSDWLKYLTPTGRFVTTDLSIQLFIDLFLSSFRSGPTVLFGIGEVTSDNLHQVAKLVADGALTPIVAHQFTFENIVEAHQTLHEQRPSGDVVVVLPGTSTQR